MSCKHNNKDVFVDSFQALRASISSVSDCRSCCFFFVMRFHNCLIFSPKHTVLDCHDSIDPRNILTAFKRISKFTNFVYTRRQGTRMSYARMSVSRCWLAEDQSVKGRLGQQPTGMPVCTPKYFCAVYVHVYMLRVWVQASKLAMVIGITNPLFNYKLYIFSVCETVIVLHIFQTSVIS